MFHPAALRCVPNAGEGERAGLGQSDVVTPREDIGDAEAPPFSLGTDIIETRIARSATLLNMIFSQTMTCCHLTFFKTTSSQLSRTELSSSMQLRDGHPIMPSATATDPTLRQHQPIDDSHDDSLVDLSCWIRPVTKISLLCAKQRPYIPSVDLLLSQHIRGRRIRHRFCNQGWSSCNEHVRNVAEPRGPAHQATPPKPLVLPGGAFTTKIGLLATKRLKALRPKITVNTGTNKIGERKETT